LPLKEWQTYYLVQARKFPGRYYVVITLGERLICSSREVPIQEYCTLMVERYRTAAQAVFAA
jgi:hypothetical protein